MSYAWYYVIWRADFESDLYFWLANLVFEIIAIKDLKLTFWNGRNTRQPIACIQLTLTGEKGLEEECTDKKGLLDKKGFLDKKGCFVKKGLLDKKGKGCRI